MDVVQMAGKHLRERFEKGGVLYDGKKGNFWQRLPKVQGEHHDPDSAERISAFLGEKNWSRRKVSDLISLKEDLHPYPTSPLRPLGVHVLAKLGEGTRAGRGKNPCGQISRQGFYARKGPAQRGEIYRNRPRIRTQD